MDFTARNVYQITTVMPWPCQKEIAQVTLKSFYIFATNACCVYIPVHCTVYCNKFYRCFKFWFFLNDFEK